MTSNNVFNKFIKGLILIEDNRFNKHHGIDIISIFRALLVNLKEKRFAQGGSTITQQLARTLYLSNKKTIVRKLKEIVIAFYLELKYRKIKILYLYLTGIYMGQNSQGKIIKGFFEASKFYFGKLLTKLSIAEYAALIAMVKGPNFYRPHSSQGTARRIMVLGKMLDSNLITQEEFFEASKVSFPNKLL